MKRISLLCWICGWCLHFVSAQAVLENNPPGLKWYQVSTPNFRVLFPRGFEEQAQRVGNTLEHIRVAEAATLGDAVPRRPWIILQNQSAISNAFVSVLPRRAEFFSMPPQDYNFLGTNDWFDLLATHEYRHIVQYQHANRGFNRLFYFLFGNPTFAGLASVAAPDWFWEGDAVSTETDFTRSGRGRIPKFGLVFKTNLLEGRRFDYNKQHLRSFKHFIPDHYVLGYYMVSHLRNQTSDPHIWEEITARAWDVPFLPFTFSNAIKKETGLYVKDLYNEMADSLIVAWRNQIPKDDLTAFTRVNPRTTSAYTDYLYPQPAPTGVVVLKRGIGDIEKFCLLQDGTEVKVFVPGIMNNTGMLSAEQNTLVWNEYRFDPRWRVRNFSVVMSLDVVTGNKSRISPLNARHAGAAISPDGKRVVTVESSNEYQNSLLILDANEGTVIKRFPNPSDVFYVMPRWGSDNKTIAVVEVKDQEKSLVIWDADSDEIKERIEVGSENVGYPVLYDKYLLFNSPVSGIDNIYAFDLTTKKRYQLTKSKYGAYNPAIDEAQRVMYYNDQSKNGMDVVKVPFDPATWEEFTPPAVEQKTGIHETHAEFLDDVPSNEYPVTRYKKIRGLFNPYSWGAYVSNDLTNITAGISSRDVLNTTSLNLGYIYDISENTGAWGAQVSYQGLFPIVDVGTGFGNRARRETAFGNRVNFEWKEVTAEAGLRVPLLLTNSKYHRGLSLGNAVGISHVYSFDNEVIDPDGEVVYNGIDRIAPGKIRTQDSLVSVVVLYNDQQNDGNLFYNHMRFSFYNLLKQSYRDFLSPWGQTLDFEWYSTPFETDFKGWLWAIRSTLYFRGIAKHHYFYTRGAYQKILSDFEFDTYTFRNRIPKPRGHSYPTDESFLSLSANYALPLLYPDVHLGPLLNVQRVKLNLFFDYGQGKGTTYFYGVFDNGVYFSERNEIYQSFGGELTFDFNVMRYLPRLEMGLRASYLTENAYNDKGLNIQFLIGSIGF